MRLQACLNGARSANEHPALPLTPRALARDAVEVRQAGAESVRVMPRDASGRVSLAAEDVAAALAAIRVAAPGLPVGVGLDTTDRRRGQALLAAIRAWTILPDFASVDVEPEEADAVVGLLAAREIGVEAGVATRWAARRFIASRLPRYSLRVIVGMPAGDRDRARVETAAVLAILRDGGITAPILLHGRDAGVWPTIDMAAEHGLAARVGFEDGLGLPGGVLAVRNAALVARAARILAGTA